MALLMAGVPVAVLIVFGRVEILAEVASLLHLFMYGLICLSLLVLRRRNPEWYEPSYRAPGYPVLPALATVTSFGLVAFMSGLFIVLGLGVLALSAIWYLVYVGSPMARGGEA